ncbi:hypothetical protein DSCO28_63050 [Desulfosarcina ovata subsp. sediminis]|uniref:DUF2914 domain-containing protein n=1 Tax=Desulfosarcina ovata subsp. sediminis TaxID=885957 RepID=A0A5K7ZZN7_9BACT|nr:DUF2914 domain-containing protein [Desulfosarcina ovata]BBO85739.1 hypothetical protein DSCO28_63050 [Desulfosarcina ovata subsp. sediminis]
MTRETIETHDQVLLKKIRDIVDRKEKKIEVVRPLWKSPKIWLPAIALAVVIAGLTIFEREPSRRRLPPSSVAAGIDRDLSQLAPAPAVPTPATRVAPVAPSAGPEETAAAPIPTSGGPVDTVPVEESEAVPLEVDTPPDRETTTLPASQKGALNTDSRPSLIRIAALATCAEVRDRQCVSPQDTFSLNDGSMPVVWMNVLSDAQPFTLTHVYFHDGEKYSEIPLAIRFPRMRTWSRITLSRPSQAGRWRVEVMTEAGETIGQIEFTVVP